jgi:hypothetical protein
VSSHRLCIAILGLGIACATPVFALEAGLQNSIQSQLKSVQSLAADPVIVAAVKTRNEAKPAEAAAMTQDKWKSLSVLDPFVRSLSKNTAADTLRAKKTEAISEAFISAADGTKVAFLGKTTSWSHTGKPKHELPMSGKTWQGDVEVDESSGLQQVQVSVPILDGGKPIGSLVVGLSVSKLQH